MFNIPTATADRQLKNNKNSCQLGNSPVALSSAIEDNIIHLSIFKFKYVSTLLENSITFVFL